MKQITCRYIQILLTELTPHQVVTYFNKNWHNIREQRVTGLMSESGNFLNSTNNRLESFNLKLKSVILVHSNLPEFLKNFLLF